MVRSTATVRLHSNRVDAHLSAFTLEFSRTFGIDVQRHAKRSLRRSPGKKPTSGPGGMNEAELKAYKEYVSRRRYWQRLKRLGRLPKRYNGELPKKYRLPPSKAYRRTKVNGRIVGVPIVPRATAPPGKPPYLHDSQQRLKRLIRFDVQTSRAGGVTFVRRVLIGPLKTSTRSEAGTPRILEYGRSGGSRGNPFMRPAFEKSLKKISQIGRHAARRAKAKSRR